MIGRWRLGIISVVLLAIAFAVMGPVQAKTLAATDTATEIDRADNPAIAHLLDLLKVPETIEIMQVEGRGFGEDIATSMLPEGDIDTWEATVARIYDAQKMYDLIATHFERALDDTDIDPLIAYYETPQAARIVTLEVAARRAFLDPETEAAAQDRFEELDGQDVRLMEQIDKVIADSDLIETNVAGALNADLMFYRGLVDGGALEMSEEEILADVWAQEQDLRESTANWLGPFLLLAYQPLEPETLDGYIAFWRTAEGRALNRAIFAGFDQMYEDISYLLGQAVAQELTTQKL